MFVYIIYIFRINFVDVDKTLHTPTHFVSNNCCYHNSMFAMAMTQI